MKSLFNFYRAMTSPLKRIESHPQEARQLIGIDYAQFLSLVAMAQQKDINKNRQRLSRPQLELMLKVADVNPAYLSEKEFVSVSFI